MILSCNNISKSFGTDVIIKSCSFNIEDHEKAAIVGINGAGKSTLLKIITGIEPADTGLVTLAKDKTLGYLSQQQNLNSDNTIYDELLSVKQYILDMEAQLRSIENQMKSADDTALETLMKKYSDQYALSISATTRSPRSGEKDGVEYFFRTKEQFEKMIADDELIEYAKYVDNYYGTPKAYVEEQLAAGKDVILEIEIQGALKVKEKFPDTLLMFVTPPSAEELKNRLVGRGTEEMSVIESRLSRAVEEAQGIEAYDYLIVNDKLDACVEEVHSIIHNEHFRVSRNLSAISDMRHQLTAFSKKD